MKTAIEFANEFAGLAAMAVFLVFLVLNPIGLLWAILLSIAFVLANLGAVLIGLIAFLVVIVAAIVAHDMIAAKG